MANATGSATYRSLEPFTLAGAIFLAISLPATAMIHAFEAWIRKQLGMI